MLEKHFDKMESEKVRNLIAYNKMIKRLYELTAKLRAQENFTTSKIDQDTKEKIKRVFLKLWEVLNAQMKEEKKMKNVFLQNLIEMMKELSRFDIWDKNFLEFGEFIFENAENKYDLFECLSYLKKNEAGN